MYKLVRRRKGFFDDLFDDFFQTPTTTGVLKTDVVEKNDIYELRVDVPGLEKDEINIKLEKGYLCLSVNKTQSSETEDDYYLRRERITSSASRKFYIGEGLNEEEIEAKLDKGVLTISVPKEIEKVEEEKIIQIK